MDDAMDLVAPDGGLWIRRQVFEHSVSSATLLGSATAARIDFPRLAAALAAASVTMHPDEPPAVTYSTWAAVAEELAFLSTPEDADLIIEALETNAPSAFVRCNDVEKLAPGRQVDYRHLLIPVPELLAFLKLHAAAALAARFRETADSVWPASAPDASPDHVPAAPSSEQMPASPDVLRSLGSLAPASSPSHGLSSNISPLPIPSVSALAGPGPASGTPSSTLGGTNAASVSKLQGHVLQTQVAHSPQSPSPRDSTGAVPSSAPFARGPASPAIASHSGDLGPGPASGASSVSGALASPSAHGAVASPPRGSITPPAGVPTMSLRSPGGGRSGPSAGSESGGDVAGAHSWKKSTPLSPMHHNSPSAIVASVSHSLQRETHLVAQVLPALLTCIAGAYGIVADVPQSPGRGSASGSLAASPRAGPRSKETTPRTPSPLPISHLSRSGAGVERDATLDMEDGVRNASPSGSGAVANGAVGQEKDADVSSPSRARQIAKARLALADSAVADGVGDSSQTGGDSAVVSAKGGGGMLGTPPGSKANMQGTGGAFGSSGASDSSAGKAQSVSNIMITRNLFEHLSFLLTTAASPSGDRHLSISTIVPEWRDPACSDPVKLGRLVELTTTALTTMSADPESGPIDTAEIRDLDKKTIVRRQLPATSVDPTEFPHGREVRISNCRDSNVYLLCSLGRVSLIGCLDVVLFVGSCVSVSVISCERVKVHTVARVCRVTSCFDSELYLCTNRRPQIVGDCRGISFAPYNAIYVHVQRDLAAVGVDPSRNIWDQYFRPTAHRERTSSGSATALDLSPAVVSTVAPEKFFPFAVPVAAGSAEGSSTVADTANAFSERDPFAVCALFDFDLPLPAEYKAVIDERRQALESVFTQMNKLDSDAKGDVAMSDLVPSAGDFRAGSYTSPGPSAAPGGLSMQEGQQGESHFRAPADGGGLRAHAHHVIQERFRSWLVSSNNMRQVVDLAKIELDVDSTSASRMEGSDMRR